MARKKRQRRNVSEFKALLASPARGSAKLPGSGIFAVRGLVDIPGFTDVVSVGPNDDIVISVYDYKAGTINVIDWLEKDSLVRITPGFTLLLNVGLDVFEPVVEG